MFKKIIVRKNEIAILLCDKDFKKILAPGSYRLFELFGKYSVETWDMSRIRCEGEIAQYLRKHETALLAVYFETMDMGEHEIGLRYQDGILTEILAPNTRNLFWKTLGEHRLERIDIRDDYQLPRDLAALLTQSRTKAQTAVAGLEALFAVQVPAYHVAVLKTDGKIVRLLEAGNHAFWRVGRDIAVDIFDTRLQAMEVTGQEILTRDKVSLRVNLVANWRLSDVLNVCRTIAKPADHLYRELQFGLRAAVGTRTLDELLENKKVIDEVVERHIREKLAGLGFEVANLGVKDIILPGEMKTLLGQVVEAEKSAQANVIRRREETSATRSLLNTARVMEDNPVALRLKELEVLERVAERISHLSVYGGLDQVLDGLVKIAK